MSDPQTANIQLAQPTRGSDVGTWDTPVNGNMTILDGAVGGILTIALSSAAVTLSSGQYIYKQIIFTGALNAGVTVTFPSSFIKSYEIVNSTTNSSNAITLAVSGGTQVICCPPGEAFDCYNDGVNMKYKNLGRIGSYWDYAGSSVPNWVSGCTVPPYLNCDGTTFSSGTYPVLNTILGSTTLPDSRGRSRFALNQTTGRITSGGGGIDGNTNYASGGAQTVTLTAGQIPSITSSGTVLPPSQAFFLANNTLTGFSFTGGGGTVFDAFPNGTTSALAASGGVTVTSQNTGGGAHPNLPPGYVGGLTLIRAG